MLRNRPRLKYCGLTVILSNPSRFDTVSLLSGPAARLFSDGCLRPEFNSMMCDIRVSEDNSPFLPGTKVIVCCGEVACHKWIPVTNQNTIGEVRGGLYEIAGIPAIPTFFPQDACDYKDYESRLNPLSSNYTTPDNEDSGTDGEDDEGDVKRHGRTKRSNYFFWIRADIRKAKQLLLGNRPEQPRKPIYITYPRPDEVISIILESKDSFLYIDIETDFEEANIQCFSFAIGDGPIYNVPILDFNYRNAYLPIDICRIFSSLAEAFRNNTVVAHNGAMFDFLVFAYKYRIPIVRAYDTLIAMHRCFPAIEKSLGHCISYWTWENFHKDEDALGYHTQQQMTDRMAYCGKDVHGMRLVHKAITEYAKTIPGFEHSIQTGMESIRPYLTATVQGIKINFQKTKEMMREYDALMTEYIRIIDLLVGPTALAELKGKSKTSFAGSTDQQIRYFHEMLGYPVVARGKDTGKPSLGKKALYKLALAFPDNPVIQFIIAYRTVAKAWGTLNIIPWKMDDGTLGDKRIADL